MAAVTVKVLFQREVLLALICCSIFFCVIFLECQNNDWSVVSSNITMSWISVHLNITPYFSWTRPLDSLDTTTNDYDVYITDQSRASEQQYWLRFIEQQRKLGVLQNGSQSSNMTEGELQLMERLVLCEDDSLRLFPQKARTVNNSHPLGIDINAIECGACKLGVTLIQTLSRQNSSQAEIVSKLTSFCHTFHIEDRRVCHGMVYSFQTEVLFVFANLALSPDEVCGFVIGESCSSVYNPWDAWNITLPDVPKPPVKPIPKPKKGAHKLRVLQLSDSHVDFEYSPGANSDCGEPICCHKDDGPVVKPSDAAGKFGMYQNCDVPTWTFEDMLKHISETEKIDYIISSGDSPDHKLWTQTRSTQLLAERYMMNTIRKYFPDTPVYSVLGNHEGAPVNSFPPPFIHGNYSISWLYNQLAEDWTVWLPNSTYQTIKYGAFYTTLIYPGLRIVSINTNYCNSQNWWLLLNTTDPANELQWLIKVLQQAENDGEKVHILGHIPTGLDDCAEFWSKNYQQIVNRYESTIVAQFFAHTHHDHFYIFYDNTTSYHNRRATNVMYVGPSITTYSNVNPGYRIYDVDGFYNGSTFAVLDHTTYFANLTEANINGKKLNWQMEYSAKSAYNMSSLNPSDWNVMYEKMKIGNDSQTLQDYIKYNSKSFGASSQCDLGCRRRLLCDVETTRSNDKSQCQDLDNWPAV